MSSEKQVVPDAGAFDYFCKTVRLKHAKRVERANRNGKAPIDEIAWTVKEHFRAPLLEKYEKDAGASSVPRAWSRFLNDLQNDFPASVPRRYTGKPDFDDIQDNILDKWTQTKTTVHKDVALLAYFWAHTMADDRFAAAASSVDRSVLGKSFERVFGDCVPRTKSEAKALYDRAVEKEERNDARRKKLNVAGVIAAVLSIAVVIGGSYIFFGESSPAIVTEVPGKAAYNEAITHLQKGNTDAYLASLRQSNEQGYPVASARLGAHNLLNHYSLNNEELGERYVDTAMERGLPSLARSGDTEAQLLYGYMLVWGVGVEKEVENGVDLLVAASSKGNPRAGIQLARLYLYNESTNDDCDGLSFAIAARQAEELDGYDVEALYYDRGLCPEGGKDHKDRLVAAIELLTHAAERGNAQAAWHLGRMYAYNRDMPVSPENDKIALKHFRYAADKGVTGAQVDLGIMLYTGRGLQVSADNNRKAVDLFRKAASKGDTRGQTEFGLAYDLGRGIALDDEEAVRWYKLAAKQGFAQAQRNLALMYREDEGIADNGRNDEIAVDWFRKAAEQGDAEAQTNLGWMYEVDRGVPKRSNNDAIAVSWYRQAAEQGLPRAQSNLALMYENNRGVDDSENNVAIAEDWYRKAMVQGDQRTRILLAKNLMARFKPETQEWEEAIELLVQASDGGEGESSTLLGQVLMATSVPGSVGEALGVERLLLARKQGDPYGAYMVAQTYLESDGYSCTFGDNSVEITSSDARDALEFSAAKGNSCALNLMGVSYEIGALHKTDSQTALDYYRQSMEAGNQSGEENHIRLSSRLAVDNRQMTFARISDLGVRGSAAALCGLAYETLFNREHRDLATAGGTLKKLRDMGLYSKDETDALIKQSANDDHSSVGSLVCSPFRENVISVDNLINR